MCLDDVLPLASLKSLSFRAEKTTTDEEDDARQKQTPEDNDENHSKIRQTITYEKNNRSKSIHIEMAKWEQEWRKCVAMDLRQNYSEFLMLQKVESWLIEINQIVLCELCSYELPFRWNPN